MERGSTDHSKRLADIQEALDGVKEGREMRPRSDAERGGGRLRGAAGPMDHSKRLADIQEALDGLKEGRRRRLAEIQSSLDAVAAEKKAERAKRLADQRTAVFDARGGESARGGTGECREVGAGTRR